MLRRGLDGGGSARVSGWVQLRVAAAHCGVYSHVLIVALPNLGIPHADNLVSNNFVGQPLNVRCSGSLALFLLFLVQTYRSFVYPFSYESCSVSRPRVSCSCCLEITCDFLQ